MADKDKGEWAETADEGIVPDELGGADESRVTGRTTGSDVPATEEGVDRSRGRRRRRDERRRLGAAAR